MLVLNGQDRLSVFFFLFPFGSRKCRRMQDTASVNLHLRPFPASRVSCLQTVLPYLCQSEQWQTRPFSDKRRRRNTHDRKPCPHDNDGHGTSVTAAGKRCFPLVRCAALSIFLWRVAPYFTSSPFSFPPLQVYANVPMPPFQTASVVIFVAGAKVKTGLGTQIFVGKISTLRRLR